MSTDFHQRCCQCGRTESWSHVGVWDLIVCACGHEVCGSCQPLDPADTDTGSCGP